MIDWLVSISSPGVLKGSWGTPTVSVNTHPFSDITGGGWRQDHTVGCAGEVTFLGTVCGSVTSRLPWQMSRVFSPWQRIVLSGDVLEEGTCFPRRVGVSWKTPKKVSGLVSGEKNKGVSPEVSRDWLRGLWPGVVYAYCRTVLPLLCETTGGALLRGKVRIARDPVSGNPWGSQRRTWTEISITPSSSQKILLTKIKDFDSKNYGPWKTPSVTKRVRHFTKPRPPKEVHEDTEVSDTPWEMISKVFLEDNYCRLLWSIVAFLVTTETEAVDLTPPTPNIEKLDFSFLFSDTIKTWSFANDTLWEDYGIYLKKMFYFLSLLVVYSKEYTLKGKKFKILLSLTYILVVRIRVWVKFFACNRSWNLEIPWRSFSIGVKMTAC